MKKITYTITLLLLLSNITFSQDADCARKTSFGSTEICLPEIEGYQECYPDPIVKMLADGTEVPANMVLGYYLTNEIFEKRDSLGLLRFDDYFKIYGTKQIKDHEADSELLKQMQDILASNFISKNWDQMEKEIDLVKLGVEIGVPTIIKNYNLTDDSFTLVMLTTYEMEDEVSYTMAMTINGLLINKRLVWMAYYLDYEGEDSISLLEKNSNSILTQVLEAGK